MEQFQGISSIRARQNRRFKKYVVTTIDLQGPDVLNCIYIVYTKGCERGGSQPFLIARIIDYRQNRRTTMDSGK